MRCRKHRYISYAKLTVIIEYRLCVRESCGNESFAGNTFSRHYAILCVKYERSPITGYQEYNWFTGLLQWGNTWKRLTQMSDRWKDYSNITSGRVNSRKQPLMYTHKNKNIKYKMCIGLSDKMWKQRQRVGYRQKSKEKIKINLQLSSE